MKLQWSTWHYPPDMPNIGDYVQATGGTINDRNEPFTSTGIVLLVNSVAQIWDMIGSDQGVATVEKWRRGYLPECEEEIMKHERKKQC